EGGARVLHGGDGPENGGTTMSQSEIAGLDHDIEVEASRSNRPSLRVVYQVLADRAQAKRVFLLGSLLVLVGTVATLYEPRWIGRTIDQAIIPKDLELLGRMALFYLGVVTLRVACLIGQQYVFEILA